MGMVLDAFARYAWRMEIVRTNSRLIAGQHPVIGLPSCVADRDYRGVAMDQVQGFCGAVAAAYFLWVAKCWWTTDREGLAFQRKAWIFLFAVLIVDVAYTFGVAQGASAVLDVVQRALHVDLTPKPSDPVRTDSHAGNALQGVMIPGWATFYLVVLWVEILLAIGMPDRKRSHSEPEQNPSARDSEGPGA